MHTLAAVCCSFATQRAAQLSAWTVITPNGNIRKHIGHLRVVSRRGRSLREDVADGYSATRQGFDKNKYPSTCTPNYRACLLRNFQMYDLATDFQGNSADLLPVVVCVVLCRVVMCCVQRERERERERE